MTAELDDIIRALKRGEWEVWKKVRALDRSGFIVKCCMNSEQVQRIKVIQTGGRSAVVMEEMNPNPPGEMPVEIAKILDACESNQTLEQQIVAFNRSRFDLDFECKGGGLVNWQIGDA